MNIEAEIRTFITEEQYKNLLEYFQEHGELIKEDYQETFYFDCEEDLRIQKNDFGSKVWMKKGKLHDEHREEIEIKFSQDQFEELEKLFLALGYNTEIKWFRKRHKFKWDDTTVCIDYTKGYGYIIELEKMCDNENKEQEYEKLKQKLQSLNLEISSREHFEEKFNQYKKNWRNLV